MAGFVVFDYADQFAVARRRMAGWLKDGRLKSREQLMRGLENFPDALLALFRGDNTGKLVLQVADE